MGDVRVHYNSATPAKLNALAHTRGNDIHLAPGQESHLAHEAWHVRHGPDEKSAYEYQLITLIQLGVSPESGTYRSVQVSMLRVLEARKRNKPDKPERLLAGLAFF